MTTWLYYVELKQNPCSKLESAWYSDWLHYTPLTCIYSLNEYKLHQKTIKIHLWLKEQITQQHEQLGLLLKIEDEFEWTLCSCVGSVSTWNNSNWIIQRNKVNKMGDGVLPVCCLLRGAIYKVDHLQKWHLHYQVEQNDFSGQYCKQLFKYWSFVALPREDPTPHTGVHLSV